MYLLLHSAFDNGRNSILPDDETAQYRYWVIQIEKDSFWGIVCAFECPSATI